MTQVNYDAFNLGGGGLLAAWHNEIGHHVEFVLPGDFNNNGTVDAADYTVWRNGLGPKYTQTDYADWKANFGLTAGNSANENAPVPEPATMTFLIFVAVGWCLQRRRTASKPNTAALAILALCLLLPQIYRTSE